MKLKFFPVIIISLLLLCACGSSTFKGNEYFTPVGDAIWEDAKNFSEGYAAVKQNGLWGFIDESGEIVIEPQ